MPDQTSHQFTQNRLLVRDWYNCYANGWTQNDITPAAFSHPAKFSKGLIKRIYDHMLTEGYIKPGDKIVDPFGGVGLGALYAMRNGLHWRGVELEEKFVGLGQANIDLWNGRFSAHFPNWGTAEIVQGDSRFLSSVLTGASGAVSSPPYAAGAKHTGGVDTGPEHIQGGELRYVDYGRTPGQLGAMKEGDIAAVTSPPYAEAVQGKGEGPGARFDPVFHKGENSTKKSSDNGYGETAGNLGNLAAGAVSSPPYASGEKGHPSLGSVNKDDWGNDGRDIAGRRGVNGKYSDNTPGQLANLPPGDVAAVTSPPYAEAVQGIGEGPGARFDPVFHKGENSTKKSSDNGYGETAGNLGNMVGAVTSPPYFETHVADQEAAKLAANGQASKIPDGAKSNGVRYGQTPGQLGTERADTFWQAARDILIELHAVLTPGGYAAFVCGDYIRDGRRVYFGRQWLQLCEAVGFTGVEWIRAWKREPGPIQTGIFEDKDCTVDRVSFFRRLANNRAVENGNAEAVVLNEDVLIVQKPMTRTEDGPITLDKLRPLGLDVLDF